MIYPFRALATLATLLVVVLLSSCGYATRVDPPVYWDQTPAQAKLAAEAHARDIGGKAYQSVGVSMEPLITAGDWVVTNTREAFDVKRLQGRVITYVPDPAQLPFLPGTTLDTLIGHRAVAADGGGIIASGDNNRWSEAKGRVTTTNYRGEVVGIYTTRRNPKG